MLSSPHAFENPLRQESANLVHDVLVQKKKFTLPITAIIGAYYITTKYLHVPRASAKSILDSLLGTESLALYPYVSAETALAALEYASIYDVESWDGYLIGLATRTNGKIILSLDEELKKKIKKVAVLSPFDPEKIREYHKFLTKKIGR